MKEHITVEDLLTLDEKQRETLRTWWRPRVGDWVTILKDGDASVDQMTFLMTGCLDETGVFHDTRMIWLAEMAPDSWPGASDYAIALVDHNNDEYADYRDGGMRRFVFPLLSIPQMIDYLMVLPFGVMVKDPACPKWASWVIGALEGRISLHEVTAETLCDALWFCVKESFRYAEVPSC